jgi:hypothetical protein
MPWAQPNELQKAHKSLPASLCAASIRSMRSARRPESLYTSTYEDP